MNKRAIIKPLGQLIFTLLMAHGAHAANWSHTEVALLSGDNFSDVPSNTDYDHTMMTFSHASGWDYGDNFFFIDIVNPDNQANTYYGEISPRLSLGKMTGNAWQFGPISDISLAFTHEFGETTTANLFGLGFDFKVPHFNFVKANLYQRNTKTDFVPGATGHAPQITLVWESTFSLGSSNWLFEGFLDYALEESAIGKNSNMLAKPRLLMDLGALLSDRPSTLYVGIEQLIWRNKYGVKGIHDNVSQVMLKYVF